MAPDIGTTWSEILSMVDPRRPVLRAFFEGRNDREALVVRSQPSASPPR